MPPPPPPSASYNLKLDDFSSSDEDDDDDYDARYNEMMIGDATVHHANGYLPSMEGDDINNNNNNNNNERDDIPWAQVLPSSDGQTSLNNNYPTVQATNVTTLPSSTSMDASATTLLGKDEEEEDGVIKSPPTKKKKKKKRKKKKKKVVANANEQGELQAKAEDGSKDIADSSESSDLIIDPNDGANESSIGTTTNVLNCNENEAKPKATKSNAKSISFGTISVREYARTLGEHVVPADGGWPLGLSPKLVAEHPNNNNTNTISSSPRRWRSRSRSDSISTTPVSSPSHSSSPYPTTTTQYPTSWSIDDFETRRQIELQQRYISLIQQERKRTYEKEWEKKHLHSSSNKHHQHGHNTRNRNRSRSRSGSFSSSNNNNCSNSSGRPRSNSTRSSSMKLEMTNDEKLEMEHIINAPVSLPHGILETRPFDYKKKIINEDQQQRLLVVNKSCKKKKKSPDGKSLNGNQDSSKEQQGGGASDATTNNEQSKVAKQSNDDHTDQDQQQPVITEMDELYHKHGGRNPLFMPMKEDERRKVMLRDYDHLKMKYCSFIDDDDSNNNSGKMSSTTALNNDGSDCESTQHHHHHQQQQPFLDPTDTSITQHIQHNLETLRIQRTDPTNLGCSCRKLHVFLPGSTDKSHHKKKGSHRRLPERKVKEELRKRGLLTKGNESMSRDKMEVLLHDAIEKEPCCWGNDCICVRNGIGCQADTCSCWHVSHDVVHHHTTTTTSTTNTKNNSRGGIKNEQQQDADRMKMRCGNEHGLYVVNFYEISKCRERFVTKGVTTAAST